MVLVVALLLKLSKMCSTGLPRPECKKDNSHGFRRKEPLLAKQLISGSKTVAIVSFDLVTQGYNLKLYYFCILFDRV